MILTHNSVNPNCRCLQLAFLCQGSPHDVLSDIILLSQVEKFADLAGPLGTKAARDGAVGQPWNVLLTWKSACRENQDVAQNLHANGRIGKPVAEGCIEIVRSRLGFPLSNNCNLQACKFKITPNLHLKLGRGIEKLLRPLSHNLPNGSGIYHLEKKGGGFSFPANLHVSYFLLFSVPRIIEDTLSQRCHR